jgi:two-component system phosphate regulon sensor histidine kinase PhoR
VDLLELTKETVASFRLVADQSGGTIVMDHRGQDFAIKGDELHLTNIVYNLIDNSIKYSLNSPRIEVVLIEKGEQVILQVKDQGLGIPEHYQKQIFDRFFRVPSNAETHNVKGHGLGLSYTSELVKRHGGTISVKNNTNGTGCTFTAKFNK